MEYKIPLAPKLTASGKSYSQRQWTLPGDCGHSNEHVPGDKSHVLEILNRHSRQVGTINTTVFVLRLRGRFGKKIPEFFKKMSLEAKGERRLARIKDTFPDDYLKVRKMKLVSTLPSFDGSPEYRGVAPVELDRYERNLIFIVPNNKDEDEDGDHGIAGSVELENADPNRVLNSAILRSIYTD